MSTRTVQLDTNTTVTTTLCIWSCPECGIVYGIPKEFADKCRRDGARYYCPNGHSLGWSETETDELRRKLKSAESDRDYWQREEKKERDRAEQLKREKAAVKGQLTKTRNRVAKGVCPCCQRSFQNLRRHMESQHPDFTNDE